MLFIVQGKVFRERLTMKNISRLAFADSEGLALDKVMKGLPVTVPYFEGIVMPTFKDIPGITSEVARDNFLSKQ